MHELDAQVLTRSDVRRNGQYVKKTSRRHARSVAALKQAADGLAIRDGVRIMIGADEARHLLASHSFDDRRGLNRGNLHGISLDMQARTNEWPKIVA